MITLLLALVAPVQAGPTRAALFRDEKAFGPLMFQGDAPRDDLLQRFRQRRNAWSGSKASTC